MCTTVTLVQIHKYEQVLLFRQHLHKSSLVKPMLLKISLVYFPHPKLYLTMLISSVGLHQICVCPTHLGAAK